MSRLEDNNSLEILKSIYCLKNIMFEIKTNAGSDILAKSSNGK